jgi:recombination protein RecT
MNAKNSLVNNNQVSVKSVKALINSDYIKNRFREILGQKAPAFLASVANITTLDNNFKGCDPNSIITAAMVAATLDLPIDRNLGFAAIIPYKDHGKAVAQFQIMTRGFIQLAMRTGQYQTINVTEVYEDEFESYNHLTGELSLKQVNGGYRDQGKENKIIGYAAYFRLINGFEKAEYWTVDKVDAHGKKFSKTFDNQYAPWQTNREAMRRKTVLKIMLKQWGILSTEMQLGMKADQGAVKEFKDDQIEVDYVDGTDNEPIVETTQEEEEPAKQPAKKSEPKKKKNPPEQKEEAYYEPEDEDFDFNEEGLEEAFVDGGDW